MPRLTVVISDQAWPEVLAALSARYGPIPDGVQPVAWVSEIAAESFQSVVVDAVVPSPAPVRRTRSRVLRASMIHPH